MPAVVARTMFVVSTLLLAAAFATIYFNSRPAADAQLVVAQFKNAFPLLEGMHVRVGGAIAGSVGPIDVTDEGLANVTLHLDNEIEPARSDATASIRQQDTTGDSYVSFDPGRSDEPLEEVGGQPTIVCESGGPDEPCEQTLVAPRFDDLLNAFGPPERAGVQLILTELARALDERGPDLNRAAVELRPALSAATEALSEVNRQNHALRELIADAEAVTAQGATRREQLASAIDSLASLLEVTAERTEPLDSSLETLPATTSRARATLATLGRAAAAATPLARDLQAAAPGLAAALRSAPDFLGDARRFAERTRPTLGLTRRLARAGAPTIESDPQRVVTGPFDLAPAISNLLTGVLGDDNTIRALFGDDSGGVPGAGTLDGFGLGAVAVEPGDQLGYPPEHRDRSFIRVSAVLNCEMFGVEVRPGCLTDLLTELRARDPQWRAARAGAQAEGSDRGESADGDGPSDDGERGTLALPGLELEALPDLDLDGGAVSEILGGVGEGLGSPGFGPKAPGAGEASAHRPPRNGKRALTDVLDFLLR